MGYGSLNRCGLGNEVSLFYDGMVLGWARWWISSFLRGVVAGEGDGVKSRRVIMYKLPLSLSFTGNRQKHTPSLVDA